jgi:hypothetical protein
MKETIIDAAEIEVGKLRMLAGHLKKRNLLEKIDRKSTLPKLNIHQNGSVIRYWEFPFSECVHLFKEWTFNSDGHPVLNGLSQCDAAACAMTYFNVDEYVFQHLFSPMAQDCEIFGGKPLSRSATSRHIAHNITCFLKKLEILH